MKKNYTAPEAEILCFRPVEELANNLITMDDLLENKDGKVGLQTGVTGTTTSEINIKIWW